MANNVKTAEEMAQERGSILNTGELEFNGGVVSVVVDSDTGNIVSFGNTLYETQEQAQEAMFSFARHKATEIETAMTNRVNAEGTKIERGAWPKENRVEFLRYQHVYLEQEKKDAQVEATIELLRSKGISEEQIATLLA